VADELISPEGDAETLSAEVVADTFSEAIGVEALSTAGPAGGVNSEDQVPAGRSNTKGPGSATPSPPYPSH
jgi:hypothetical protein